ncbi:metal ABC transporter permease, partial [Staphylococcus epidermidis]
ADVYQLIILSGAIMIGLLIFYRYVVFDSYDPIGAQAQGLKTNLLSIYFLILLAVSVSIAAQIVGSLLVFILVTIPAFIAKYLAKSVP